MKRLRLPGTHRARTLWRKLRARRRGGVPILGYHRVADVGVDALQLSIAPRHFEQHLAVLASSTRPMRLREAGEALASGHLPHRGVVVTFDDGYADNLHVALPLLERYEVPATVFVTTATRGTEFWWDRLVRLVCHDGAGRSAAARQRAAALARTLEPLSPSERDAALRELEADTPSALPLHRSLTQAELEQLARHPLIEIGSHTMTHRPLALLPEVEQQLEIEHSKRELETFTSTKVTSFAYPHGSHSKRAEALLQRAGYSAACVSESDVASSQSAALALPRLWPADRDGKWFAPWLNAWLRP